MIKHVNNACTALHAKVLHNTVLRCISLSSVEVNFSIRALAHGLQLGNLAVLSNIRGEKMTEALVSKAKLAEQAERYEDMAKVMAWPGPRSRGR